MMQDKSGLTIALIRSSLPNFGQVFDLKNRKKLFHDFIIAVLIFC